MRDHRSPWRRALALLPLLLLTAPAAADPPAPSYSQAKNQFVQVGATRYAYRRYGADHGTPIVLLTHTRGTMDTWDPALLDVLAAGRPVITFDYKGVGLTGGKAPEHFAAMADDSADFIAALGYQRVDVLGFSIGGAVAQELMIRHPALVRRAILAGTSAKGGAGVNNLSARSQQVTTKAKMTADDFLYAFFAPSPTSQQLGKAYVERMKRRTTDLDVDVSAETLRAQASARTEWGQPQDPPDERMKAVQAPVLIANGKDDIRMPTMNSYRLFELLPRGQLILYPDAGHGFLFQYPALCGHNFAEFLDQAELAER
jgi:pimeloyl-ACP methyl ester carboxylesterase